MKEKGLTTITLKKINRNKVYQYIYQQKETSKLQIVSDLQMGLSTVSQNLNELENDGLISRNGYFESTGGRKAQIIRIVEDYRISIGLGILKDMFHIRRLLKMWNDLFRIINISPKKYREFPLPHRGSSLRMELL